MSDGFLNQSQRSGSSGQANHRASAAQLKRKAKQSVFLTEAPPEKTLDELLQHPPFTFKFVPTRTIMQKIIVRASQLKSVKDLDDIGDSIEIK